MEPGAQRAKKFHLITVDILQGIIVFPMISGHGLFWYAPDLALNYETGGFLVFLTMLIGLFGIPCYVFLNGFNQVNSFLRSPTINRGKTVKRIFLFFVIAASLQVIVFLSRPPVMIENLVRYLFTWNFFHVFAFSTITLFILWELASKVTKNRPERFIMVFRLLLAAVILTVSFLFFVTYSFASSLIEVIPEPVPLDIIPILEYAILDVRSFGIIPWISFPLAGALLASLLSLPLEDNPNEIRRDLNVIMVLSAGIIAIGILLLLMGIRLTSPVIDETATYTLFFLSHGILLLTLAVGLREIDMKEPRPISQDCWLCNLGKIALTIYMVHSALFLLDPQLIPSSIIFWVIMAIYTAFFIVMASIWRKWGFKYSLEWGIRNFTR
ncbi:MAG: hypothetical protein ACFFE8_14040 [Candidatus Heimdallarchaeota archaeon]